MLQRLEKFMKIQLIHNVGIFIIFAYAMHFAQTPGPASNTVSENASMQTHETTLSISSSPANAEIYINKNPGKRTRPDAFTPAVLANLKPEQIRLSFFKKGYADTTLLLNLASSVKNLNILMYPIHVDSLKSQNRFLQQRYNAQLGRLCFVSSPLLAAAGAGLMYYSKKNKDKADKAKSFLENTIITSGSEYDAMQHQYTDEMKKRNLKFYSGIALLGLAAIDAGVGFVLYF
jgi:hypothetical protein